MDKFKYPRNLITIGKPRASDLDANSQLIITDELFHYSVQDFLSTNCQYYFSINDKCVIENDNILIDLLTTGKNIVAPLLKRKNQLFSNFWGALDDNGYYKRSFDYIDIVEGRKRGCWNVPYISNCYLIKRSVLETHANIFNENNHMDLDMKLCHNLRAHNVYMYITNIQDYGYLLD